MTLFQPKNTFASVAQTICSGLENGEVFLEQVDENAHHSVAQLIAMLDDDISAPHAAELLSTRGNTAIYPLLEVLRDDTRSPHWPTAILGKMGGEALNTLLARLEDSNPEVRKSAARALRSFHTDLAYRALMKALHDPVVQVRVAALDSLRAFPPAPTSQLPAFKTLVSRVETPPLVQTKQTAVPRGRASLYGPGHRINVLVVAFTSAALHGGAAVLFVPIVGFLALCWQKPFFIETETMMVLAVLAPVLSGAFGFLAGAIMGIGHNLFLSSAFRARLGNAIQSRLIYSEAVHLSQKTG